jgi:hypothetical protein
MSESEKSYANTVAPRPEWGDDGATAEQLIRSCLVGGQEMFVRMQHALRANMKETRGTDAYDSTMLKYIAMLHGFLLTVVEADLMIAIHALAPDKADEIARATIAHGDSGDFYPEQMWHWLTERGIDPERIRTETEAALAAEESK